MTKPKNQFLCNFVKVGAFFTLDYLHYCHKFGPIDENSKQYVTQQAIYTSLLLILPKVCASFFG